MFNAWCGTRITEYFLNTQSGFLHDFHFRVNIQKKKKLKIDDFLYLIIF